MATITGNVEIRTGGSESIGVEGTDWTVDSVPLVLGVLKGITGMVAVTPEVQPTGRTPLAQWTAKDKQAQDVTVFLWEEIPYEDTYAAQIGPALAEQQDN